MKTIELFAGTKSFSKVMASHGHSTYTVDNDPELKPDLVCDISKFGFNTEYDILWASPPCTAFSVSSIGTHWRKELGTPIPRTSEAGLGLRLLDKTIEIISIAKPKYWFIENPRGMMRKVIDPIFKKYGITNYRRVTVCYCKYGDTRMKPTDIWTNLPNWKGKMCRNGNKCHISAPRGSKTGTQGLSNAKERGVIPPALFEEILQHIQ